MPENVREKLVKQIIRQNPKVLKLTIGHCPIKLLCTLTGKRTGKKYRLTDFLFKEKDKIITYNWIHDEVRLGWPDNFRLDLSDQENTIARRLRQTDPRFACALQPRLGTRSPAAMLPQSLIRKISN